MPCVVGEQNRHRRSAYGKEMPPNGTDPTAIRGISGTPIMRSGMQNVYKPPIDAR
ncbi:hypothetical protein BBSC_0217 [Bifidobacterium scardovii JCM 12489 = DSM 13734]|nr:hypothetical protein BBSC_0217 [Bifidobacterium scardovii JCM 12489 = DSM 13734]